MNIQWDNIPAELRQQNNWVCWRYEEREGKQTKVPYNARTQGGAMSNNASTWSSYEVAKARHESGDVDGVGFMLDPALQLVGIDLDHCIDGAEIGSVAVANDVQIDALTLINELSTYTEISPSGTGVRAFCFGFKPGPRCRKGDFEMYSNVRFLTITGNQIGEHNHIRECDLTDIYNRVFGEETESVPIVATPSVPVDLSDRELLERAFKSANGEKFRALYNGDKSAYGDDTSRADSALCFHLAFWTGRDATRMDSLFRGSGLMRPKWDEKRGAQTYGQLTIERAIAKTAQTYEPGQRIVLRGGAARRYAQGQSAAQASEWNEESTGADEDEKALNVGLYAAENGRTVLRVEKVTGRGENKTVTEVFEPIADVVCTISQEFRDEGGNAIFGIQGRTRNNRGLAFEIAADQINDPKVILSKLSNSADAGCVFFAGKEKHLAAAIKTFSLFDEVEVWRRFARTGWTLDGKEFICPGIEAPDMSINLPRKLAYHVEFPDEAQLKRGQAALTALLQAQTPEVTTVALMGFLAAPMALHADWRGERSALFISGRTGSFKSAWALCAMCLFGEAFANEDNVLKFGPGATNNARMKMFVSAGDMPLLVDNYKPGNGKGEIELVELIHTVLEGGEKDRLSRTSELRDTSPIHAWPIFTGEDTPHESSTTARCVVVSFPLAPEDASSMTLAQLLTPDLHFIGGALIEWLLTDEGLISGDYIRARFKERREYWSKHLRALRPDMANIYRVAANLAVNECAWEYALACPAVAPVLIPFDVQYKTGLLTVAQTMASMTAQSMEANRYLEAIKALLESDRAYLCPRLGTPREDERRLKIGWEDDNGVYLIPETAFTEVLKMLQNAGGLNNVSKNTIHKQLEQLGYLARRGKDEFTVRVLAGEKVTGVLHLTTAAIYGNEEDGGDE